MKIAMLGAKGVPAGLGGIERHVEELGARLATRGFTVTVYGRPWYTGRAPWAQTEHRGMRILTLPSVHTKHLDAITATVLATLHAVVEGFDIYHYHGVGPSLLAWIPRLFRPRATVITTFHCVDRKHEKWGLLARTALRIGEWAACAFPHETITVGSTLTTYCRNRYGCDTAYIPNGVTVNRQSRVADARRMLAEVGLTAQQYLLVVTRLVPHKQVHTTIAAFRKLRREHAEYRHLQLAIVGAPAFTDEYLDELHIAAGGDPQVRFLGARHGDELATLFAHARAFVHASASEGLPIVVLEAATAGLVPLVSDIPEHREVIEQIGGCMFRTGDVHDCARQLAVLLAATPSLARMGAEIRDAVLRTYDWDTLAGRVIALYRAHARRGVRGYPVMRIAA